MSTSLTPRLSAVNIRNTVTLITIVPVAVDTVEGQSIENEGDGAGTGKEIAIGEIEKGIEVGSGEGSDAMGDLGSWLVGLFFRYKRVRGAFVSCMHVSRHQHLPSL
mmetsp:Transcript_27723/g.53934  ORF Transcript_27723/g.53934 Transcript_27723/m.53934 type:complete len:106 (+) Transcript_27723:140-457(+)